MVSAFADSGHLGGSRSTCIIKSWRLLVGCQHDQLVVFIQLEVLVAPGVELHSAALGLVLPGPSNTESDLPPGISAPLQVGEAIFTLCQAVVCDVDEDLATTGRRSYIALVRRSLRM